jgi:hypothetical protein
LEVDTDDEVNERDEDNNRVNVPIDARPDLRIAAAEEGKKLPGASDGAMTVTLTISNTGLWPAAPTSGTLSLSNQQGTLLMPDRRFSLPSIGVGDALTVVHYYTLPAPLLDVYRVTAEVDPDGLVAEQNKANNRIVFGVPITIADTIYPTVAVTITSASHKLTFIFPAGSVTTPTQIVFTPLLPSDLPPGAHLSVFGFQLAAFRDGAPVSITFLAPVTVTWRYTDTDVVGLDEDYLDLFHWTDERWQRVVAPTAQYLPDENRIQTSIRHLGLYVFGQQYRCYLPLVRNSSSDQTGQTGQTGRIAPAALSGIRPPAPGLPIHLPPLDER